ncbi:MAG TPA: LytR C-terminal domain-containing protein [Acidimicrobiia bacterium]|nr:LytR C-terminal domain-containing protein [Acidimicrobiia bacterium]
MTNKGKHASQTPGTFYRDLAIMILGILLVGAAVFFLLYLFADAPATGPTTTTTTIPETTTTAQSVTTTTEDGATTTSTLASTSTTVAVRPPAEVTVVVFNSMGLDGAAGRLTSELASAGYQTITPDNYTPELDPSRIWYREGFAAEAAVLVDFVPGATIEPLPDESVEEGADVVLVLGTGYSE